MTGSEFNEFFKYHEANFPSLIGWLQRLQKGGLTKDELLRPWYGKLRYLDLDDAKAASDAMHGDLEKQPRSYDQHPAALVGIANRVRHDRNIRIPHKRIDGQETFRCLRCRDDGRLFVWHPESVAAVIKEKFGERFTVYTCVVACTCHEGDYWAFRAKMPRFDEKKWLAIQHGTSDPDDRQRLIEFAAASLDAMKPKRFTEFDAFSGSQDVNL